jgi:hypothetical protein
MKPESLPETITPRNVEIHIDRGVETFSKKYAKKVKKAGGYYRACRSPFDSKRIVVLPMTDEGKALANELLEAYPLPHYPVVRQKERHYQNVVIFRDYQPLTGRMTPINLPSTMTVLYINPTKEHDPLGLTLEWFNKAYERFRGQQQKEVWV